MEPLLNNNTSSSSSSSSSFKINPPMDVEDASSSSSSSSSAFRRRNKVLILVLLFLILLLSIVLSVLIAYFVHNFHVDSIVQPTQVVMSTLRPDFNTSRILFDSLRTAADKIQGFVSFLSTAEPAAGDFVIVCSSSAVEALRLIAGARERLRARSDDTKMEIVDQLKAAAEKLESCDGVLQRVEAAAAVKEAAAAVREVVDGGVRAAEEYEDVVVWSESEDVVVLSQVEDGVVFGMNYGIDWRGMVYENLFGIGMIALQLIYMFFLFACLFRIR